MQLKKARFAVLCGVSRPSIGENVKRGSLHEVNGRIDLNDPANMAYLKKHNPAAAEEILSGVDPSSESQPKPPETRQSVRGPKPKKAPIDIDAMNKIKKEESDFLSVPDSPPPPRNPSGYMPSYEEEVVSKRAFYEAEKIKNDAALKALELDKRNGTLIELEIVMEYMVKLSSAIQRGFLDVIPKQSLMICSRLGTVGRESEVEDLLADDNYRRIEDVKHIVEKMATAKWGIMNRHVIKDDDADSEGDEE